LPSPKSIGVEALVGIISDLPRGITELCCHPGQDGALDSMYCKERFVEMKTLCDPRVRAAIAAKGIVLRSFSDVAACRLSLAV